MSEKTCGFESHLQYNFSLGVEHGITTMTTHSREQIISLREKGLTYQQIADELGCSKAVVCYHLNPKVREIHRETSRRARQVRYEKINAYKESKPCTDCGQFFEGFLMDLDHLPEFLKVGSVSNLLRSYGWAKILAELEKCEVVCCMCHRMRTKQRWLDSPLKHSIY